MGQKIHPLGFRIGITKKHQSVWFARFHKHQYAQSVFEDKFLRQNLLKLFPQLFQKKFNNSPNAPKISHIRIVRGLIPYEIGIQIHAQNCHLLKAAFEGLEVQPNFTHNFLKNQLIFEKAASRRKSLLNNSKNEVFESTKNSENFQNLDFSQNTNQQQKNSASREAKKKNIASSTLKNSKLNIETRKKLFKSFRQRFLGKLILVKNGKRITKKFNPKKQVSLKNNFVAFFKKNNQEKQNFSSVREQKMGAKNKFQSLGLTSSNKSGAKISEFSKKLRRKNYGNFSLKQKVFLSFFGADMLQSKKSRGNVQGWSKVSKKEKASNFSKPCTKFVNLYMSRTNISFLNALKAEMNYWNQYFTKEKSQQLQKFGCFRYLPIGSQKKWSVRRFNGFENLPFPLLFKLLKSLQVRALKKMERLRKEYLIFGKFSKTKTLVYFQRIRFLQYLKKFISVRKTQKFSIMNHNTSEHFDAFHSFGGGSNAFPPNLISGQSENLSSQLLNTFGGSLVDQATTQKFFSKSLKEKSIQKKILNIPEEKNTMKFIDYLQSLVKQHRSQNLFLYLATISDARKHRRKIQHFTKQQADFLFGISPKNLSGLTNEEKTKLLKDQVSKTLLKVSQKNLFQKRSFLNIFTEQLQKQRTICEQNIQLTPKISIQFYSVKAQNFQTQASAVAYSIVDDLEKRKAFRRVIKKAKEDLMKTPKVKGVKIQVSGRLNGAEIARSEWVRAGRVPLQTLRANIDYCYKTAQTIYGIIGVKVWIYKGYTKTRKPTAKSSSVLTDLL
eukprot:GHRR01000027.1.p1 GENE.GHRR01000027.1~~GHRR01000027.1.p1  ORF type:complete len:779 (+),score=-82.32 GHRR01000027.1:5300-7636(+)